MPSAFGRMNCRLFVTQVRALSSTTKRRLGWVGLRSGPSSWMAFSTHSASGLFSRWSPTLTGGPRVIKRCRKALTGVRGVPGIPKQPHPRRATHGNSWRPSFASPCTGLQARPCPAVRAAGPRRRPQRACRGRPQVPHALPSRSTSACAMGAAARAMSTSSTAGAQLAEATTASARQRTMPRSPPVWPAHAAPRGGLRRCRRGGPRPPASRAGRRGPRALGAPDPPGTQASDCARWRPSRDGRTGAAGARCGAIAHHRRVEPGCGTHSLHKPVKS